MGSREYGRKRQIPPYSLLPTPYSLLPTPHSLLPTPHSLLPTPYSPLPTPHSLVPTVYKSRQFVKIRERWLDFFIKIGIIDYIVRLF
jgi:hypothetical protein